MNITVDQRWNHGNARWVRPNRALFDPAGYRVDRCSEADARRFVTEHHYSHSMPAARFTHALYDPDDQLVGVAVHGIPTSKKVLTGPFPTLEPYVESIELSRLVLLDAVGFNAESWTIRQVFDDIAASGVRGVVAFSDPIPRTTISGSVVLPGHVGSVYQASAFFRAGRGTARTLTVLPDGTVFSARAAQKVRSQERGHGYAEQQLVNFGAEPFDTAGEDPACWLRRSLALIGARRLAHPGNLRFCRTLGRRRHRIPVVTP